MSGKKYKIRTLMGKDIFKISKFIKKLGINKLQAIFSDNELSKSINNIVSHGENQDIAEVGKIVSVFISTVILVGSSTPCIVIDSPVYSCSTVAPFFPSTVTTT